MVITNNYRTSNVVGEKEEEEGLRRRRSRAGRAANKLPEPPVRILTRMSSSRVVRFDFQNNHRVRRRRRRKGRGTPAGARVTARSRRGGGRSWHDAFGVSRLVDRHQRNVAPLVQRRVQYFNHEFGSSSTRDGQVKRNAGGLRSA